MLDRVDECECILGNLVSRETNLTDRGVYNTELVNFEVDLTALDLFNSLRNLRSWVRSVLSVVY